MRNALCNSNEFLMFMSRLDGDFVHEAPMKPMTMSEAIEEVDDNTKRIIRMDKDTWKGEDVTEEIAMAWLCDSRPDPAFKKNLPLFVLNTDAIDTYEEEYAIDGGYFADINQPFTAADYGLEAAR